MAMRRRLGQKTLTVAIHYTATAQTVRLQGMMKKFDPLGSKKMG
jgi:hypothetical protein